jgi:2-oxoglutarate dehydrogenase E1 component
VSSFDPGNLSLEFVESLLADFLEDPSSVPADWRRYFHGMAHGDRSFFERNPRIGPTFEPPPLFGSAEATAVAGPTGDAILQHKVDELIRNFRVQGHRAAHLNPLGERPPFPAELDPDSMGILERDMDRVVSTAHLPGPDLQTVRQLVARLYNTYCRYIGAEFMHLNDLRARRWLQERMEVSENLVVLDRDQQMRILKRLTDAVVLESFIQKKYLGAKSFSLEGAETLIPLLDLAIEKAGDQGIEEIVLGMAHRGRLNVLSNILGKSPRQIFREFEDTDPEHKTGKGDVKYHLGFSSDWTTVTGRNVHLSLAFNPSHLEFINPVAIGRIRAKQDRLADLDRDRAMVLLIHGDASFAGEGVVQETLNLSQLEAYTVGGTLHVVVNNQLGFTTLPEEGRSSTYATDIAKMLQIPIFHVNGEDPEAVAQVIDVAMDFRHRFKRDVVVDMYCYRRRGHNEGDEPAFTQPLLYEKIRSRNSIHENYLDHLLILGEVKREEAEEFIEEEQRELEEALETARSEAAEVPEPWGRGYTGVWEDYVGGPEGEAAEAETAISVERQRQLLERLVELPADLHVHKTLERLFRARREMAEGKRPLDWSAAEALAFASLADEGYRVRLTGQDTERGTFSQRHAVLHDVDDGRTYVPLQHVAAGQAPVEICNSPLAEAGVLGFEYGYSLDCPDGLVCWEAQFGDFCNAAQVIIDQFIASAEDKWNRLSGIVLLLPHGFEGQGPEHSSARLERWLMLAAEDNIQVLYPTTPAQYFHCLRRQVKRMIRKPLVVLTPKSLLRHSAVASPLERLAEGTFRRVIGDDCAGASEVERILLCSGKVFYDLDARSQELDDCRVAVVRLEQLYPFPTAELAEALAPFAEGTPVYWVQEEPRNMGAWPYLRVNFASTLLDRFPLSGIYRKESASPATGSAASHKLEQEELLRRAFADLD